MRGTLATPALLLATACFAQAGHRLEPLRLPIFSQRSLGHATHRSPAQSSYSRTRRDLQYITTDTDPVQAAKDVQALPFLANNVGVPVTALSCVVLTRHVHLPAGFWRHRHDRPAGAGRLGRSTAAWQ